MTRLPSRSTRTDTLFPYTALFRSGRYNRSAIVAANPRLRFLYDAATSRYAPALLHLQPWSRSGSCRAFRQRRRYGPVGEQQASRSEEHTSELQSLMRISYAVFCLKKKNTKKQSEKNCPTNTN